MPFVQKLLIQFSLGWTALGRTAACQNTTRHAERKLNCRIKNNKNITDAK